KQIRDALGSLSGNVEPIEPAHPSDRHKHCTRSITISVGEYFERSAGQNLFDRLVCVNPQLLLLFGESFIVIEHLFARRLFVRSMKRAGRKFKLVRSRKERFPERKVSYRIGYGSALNRQIIEAALFGCISCGKARRPRSYNYDVITFNTHYCSYFLNLQLLNIAPFFAVREREPKMNCIYVGEERKKHG